MIIQSYNFTNSDKIFIIKRSEIEGRLEPDFYRPSIVTLENLIKSKTKKKISDYALYMAGGATPKKDEREKYYTDAEHGKPFLRVQNLQQNGELSLEDCVYINDTTHYGLLNRSIVTEGDLLVKITGVGRMAIASVAPKGFEGNTNQHMVVIKTGDARISHYLARYLNLDIIEKIASRHSTGGTRPALDYPSLRNIPVIEGLDFSSIDNAYIFKKNKDLKARELLGSINTYLLNELELKLPIVSFDFSNRLFTSSFSSLTGNRMDPFFAMICGKEVYSIKYDITLLYIIADIYKGSPLSSKDVVPGNVPVIAGGKTSPYSHNIYNVVGNSITVSSSGAYSGYVWYHEQPIFATDCCVIKSKDEKKFLTRFIFEILKLQQQSIYWLQTGSAQPHVYANDLMYIKIPIIPLSKQHEIINYIENIREEANSLVKEGRFAVRKANKEVEEIIKNS